MDFIRNYRFPAIEQEYAARDAMLYALGLGYGTDPVSSSELPFVYEDHLKAVPSMCVVLAHPGFWAKRPEFGIDWVKILHGEQSFEIHRPIPPRGVVRGEFSIDAVDDKGPEKGAVLYQSKRLYDGESNALLATVRSAAFLRGDGGCGSFGSPPPQAIAAPDGPPDLVRTLPTLPQQALIYRLSGDYNPIHADPVAAAKAGFERPILHGLCTMGVATRAIIDALAPGAPERLKSMFVRFSRPVFPGETVATEMHRSDGPIRFRCRVVERDVVVLDRGAAVLE